MKNSLIIPAVFLGGGRGGGAESTRASASTCTSRPAAVDAHLHNSLITTPLPACTRPPRLHHCLPRSRLTRTGRRARPQRTDSPFSDRLRLRLLSKSGRGGAAPSLWWKYISCISGAAGTGGPGARPVARLPCWGQNVTIYEVGSFNSTCI